MSRRFCLILLGVQISLLSSSAFAAEEGRLEKMVDRITPSIVQVGVATGTMEVSTVGSGVVVSANGYILTAKHNITGAAHVFVKTSTGTVCPALFYVADAHRDIALIKAQCKRLTPIAVSKREPLRGEEILALGFPASNMIQGTRDEASVSKGIVSGVNRAIREPRKLEDGEYGDDSNIQPKGWFLREGSSDGSSSLYVESLIQIDAMVNPGSSGGALVNTNGELLGIILSQITNTGSNVGMNFAISVKEAALLLAFSGASSGGNR